MNRNDRRHPSVPRQLSRENANFTVNFGHDGTMVRLDFSKKVNIMFFSEAGVNDMINQLRVACERLTEFKAAVAHVKETADKLNVGINLPA